MRDQAFMKSLFFGEIEEGLLFPWPAPGPQEVDAARALLDPVRRFFERAVDGHRIDQEGRIPEEVVQGLRELGLFGLTLPTSHGGAGLTNTGFARVLQEVWSLDASVGMTLGAHLALGAKGLLLFGSADLRDHYLPRMASGELVAAFALTEATGGSDAAAVQTRAEQRGEGYVLSGTKTWVTNGGLADLFTVFARTSPSEEGVKPKITAFLVERGWGVRSGPNEPKLGVRGASTTALSLDSVRVPATHVLGQPARGFGVATQVLNSGHLALASGCVGVCRRLLRLAVERCRDRRAFGRPIGEFGLVKDKIATMAAETWALESMTYLTTGWVDSGVADWSIESAICKVFGSETCWRVADEVLQIAASAGFAEGPPYERLLRDARANRIFGGTSEILRAFIALSGMQGPGRALADVARAIREPIKGFGFLSELALRKARSALGRERLTRPHPVLKREALLLEHYVNELARGTEKVLRRHGRDIAEMQYTQKRTANLAIDLYALAACLSRATSAVERRGEQGARRELDLTSIFASAAEKRMAEIVADVDKNDDELRKNVAARTYNDGGYPFDGL